MLVFDKQRKRCVAPPTDDCDVPTTPAPNDDNSQQTNDISNNNNNYHFATSYEYEPTDMK